jgi:hypothetical protein
MANRFDTPSNWATQNPVLAPGEIGVETTGRFKFGDGTTAWNALPYAAGDSLGSFFLF